MSKMAILEANIDVMMRKMDGMVRKVTIASVETTDEGLPPDAYMVEDVQFVGGNRSYYSNLTPIYPLTTIQT